MSSEASRVFISYRRDDAAGYAGRLEESLERRLGRGSVFRDVQDIAPGEDFVRVIRDRLAGAHTVLVLIGPRWAGADAGGARRIDDERDFVRLEVQAALELGARIVPVLLPGATMPAEDALPDALQPLARRNALPIGDANWDADVGRLVAAFGEAAPRRRVWPWALGSAAVAGAVAATLCVWQPWRGAEAGQRLIGSWAGEVKYPWGAAYTERIDFERHAGVLTGTATFLAYPRGIENLVVEGRNVRFETRSQESVSSKTYDVTHHYSVELRGEAPDEVLAIRMHSTGGFGGSSRPLEFEARRAAAAASAASR